jgi:hypothetical protein
MKLSLLRFLLLIDAGILFLLGAVLILAPGQVERAFHFQNLPPAVAYLMGLWGCVFATMALGYLVASTHPLRHRAWIQVGIARGALECALGLFYLVRGTVTFQQAGFGIIVAGLMAIAYIVLYPSRPRLVNAPEIANPSPPPTP